MPKATVTLNNVIVTIDVQDDLAPMVTKEDLHEMAMSAIQCNQSGIGVKTICDGKCQWEDMGPDYAKSPPIMADAYVEGCHEGDMVLDDIDEKFTKLT